MIEQQAKILKLMSEMVGRVDLSEFAKRVGLTSTEILQQMQELAKEGYLRRAGGGFAITDKGKNALKPYKAVPENMNFTFYIALDQPTAESAGNINEFYAAASKIDVASLEFHLYRGDFEKWFQDAAEDPNFAQELSELKSKQLKGEELKKALIEALAQKYSI